MYVLRKKKNIFLKNKFNLIFESPNTREEKNLTNMRKKVWVMFIRLS